MGLTEILAALDDEIRRLTEARNLLAGTKGIVTQKATSFAFGANQNSAPRKRRRMSAKARARISAAQRKRWAAKKKAAK
jgi:hypothetical protein